VKGDQSLSAPAHPRWLALPLEGDVDRAAAVHVEALIGGEASTAFIAETTAMVAELSGIVRRQAEAFRRGDVLTQFAWMLMPAPNLLLPGPIATLYVRWPPPDASQDDSIAAACDLNIEREGEVDLSFLETASGPALHVRYHPVLQIDGERVVAEHRVVLWPRYDDSMTLELSSFSLATGQGEQRGDPLLERARSIEWVVD